MASRFIRRIEQIERSLADGQSPETCPGARARQLCELLDAGPDGGETAERYARHVLGVTVPGAAGEDIGELEERYKRQYAQAAREVNRR